MGCAVDYSNTQVGCADSTITPDDEMELEAEMHSAKEASGMIHSRMKTHSMISKISRYAVIDSGGFPGFFSCMPSF